MIKTLGTIAIDGYHFQLDQLITDQAVDEPTAATLWLCDSAYDDPVKLGSIFQLHTERPLLYLEKDLEESTLQVISDHEQTVLAGAARLWRESYNPSDYPEALADPEIADLLHLPELGRFDSAFVAISSRADNKRILDGLISLANPSRHAVQRARELLIFPDPFGRPLATLRRAHVNHVLKLFYDGDLKWNQVTVWAETVLLHASAPRRRPYLALEPGAESDLTTALTLMTVNNPPDLAEYQMMDMLTRERHRRWRDTPWAAAGAAIAAIAATIGFTSLQGVPAMVPDHLALLTFLAVIIPTLFIYSAWATAGITAILNQAAFWSVIWAAAVVAAAVFGVEVPR
jgi:hypothetical protein